MISDGTWRHHFGDARPEPDVPARHVLRVHRRARGLADSHRALVRPARGGPAVVRHLDGLRLRRSTAAASSPATSWPSSAAAASARARSKARCTPARARSSPSTPNQSKVERAMKIGATHGCATAARRGLHDPAGPHVGQELRRGDHHGGRADERAHRAGALDHRARAASWSPTGAGRLQPDESIDLNLFSCSR